MMGGNPMDEPSKEEDNNSLQTSSPDSSPRFAYAGPSMPPHHQQAPTQTRIPLETGDGFRKNLGKNIKSTHSPQHPINHHTKEEENKKE
jgi:hypothetical protein